MPNLDAELKHLALADEHLFEGAQRIKQMRALVDHGRSLGLDVTIAERAVDVMVDAMAAMAEHRQAIAAAIDAIQRGVTIGHITRQYQSGSSQRRPHQSRLDTKGDPAM